MNALTQLARDELRPLLNREPTPLELATFRRGYLLGMEQAQIDESLRLRNILDTAHVAGEVA